MTWNVPDDGGAERPNTTDRRAELLAQGARLNARIDAHLSVLRGERPALLSLVPDLEDDQARRIWSNLAANRERIESMRRHPSSQRPTLRLIEGGAG